MPLTTPTSTRTNAEIAAAALHALESVALDGEVNSAPGVTSVDSRITISLA